MFDTFSFKWLWFTRPTGEPAPPGEGLERIWVPTQGGRIELLAALPPKGVEATGPPIVFCHGGMGGAWVWKEYMTYLAQKGVRCYAVSLRGHGNSWCPHYLRMVFGTTRSALVSDFVAAVEEVEKREGEKVVLVGHSSGGGLSQDILGKGLGLWRAAKAGPEYPGRNARLPSGAWGTRIGQRWMPRPTCSPLQPLMEICRESWRAW